IFDEAHKTVGKDGGLFSHLIYDKNIKIARKIFMTATERHYKGNSEKIASMDNPLIYGDDFEVLSFKEALLANPPILCDYKIITMLINSSEIASLIEQNIAVSGDDGKAVESEMIAAMIALQKAMDKYPIKHAVSFHSSIKKAKTFKELVGKFNSDTEAFHVSGKTPTASRSKMINNFAASQKAVITNARCLTEGVDVPGIDAVLFANPRKSVVDIVQAVGRALRIFEGKQYGYVIVPVVIDSDNLEESEAGAYDAVIAVLKALAANDERIVDYFGDASSGKQPMYSSPLIVESALDDAVSLDISEFSKAVELQIWSSTKKLAWRPFEEARGFVRDLGLDGVKEWQDYCKSSNKPRDIPSSPSSVYAGIGWLGMADWLGNEWLHFEEAREFARRLGLNGAEEWKEYCKSGNKPSNIPS
ncbi:MAG TPA: helicase-related protein, partial [Campylobacterales bacterium]|nr:helicase-related protein [Campylobacterales bacterium]